MELKLSLGSAISLGLAKGKLDVELQTIYLMLGSKCTANCKYCAQARGSKASKKLLSRVTWHEFPLNKILERLEDNKAPKRLCIQTLKYPELLKELVRFVKEARNKSNILISACVNPLEENELLMLKDAGVSNIGIGLDCASKDLFYNLKPGCGSWEDYIEGIRSAVNIFGHCTVHLIIGLGESDFEAINIMSKLKELGAVPALFSFTPLKGLALDSDWPSLERYRAVQLARRLIVNENAKLENFEFENSKLVRILIDKKKLVHAVNLGKPFQARGCKYCTRPFYNERPSGPLYNYPKELSREEIEKVKVELRNYGVFG
ncbi:MAG: radical SAM protein [Candidatus Thermoplasmatota archaeon]